MIDALEHVISNGTSPGRTASAGERDAVTDEDAPRRGRHAHRRGPQTGSAKVHRHTARHSGLGRPSPHIGDHPLPHAFVVMRAVDAGAVHASSHEVSDQWIVVGGFARQRHHDADFAPSPRPSEHLDGVDRQSSLATIERRARGTLCGVVLVGDNRGERRNDGVQAGKHVCLASSER